MKTCTAIAMLALWASTTPAFAQTDGAVSTQAASSPAVAPIDPGSLAIAREILTTAFPPEKRSQMYASMMDSLAEQARQGMDTAKFSNDKEFQALLDRSTQRIFDAIKVAMNAAIPDYFESVAHAYARRFSLDELNAILVFAKTPAGQHYFAESTNILKDPDVQAASRHMSEQLMAKLPEITRQSTQDIADYIAKKEKQDQPTEARHVS